MVEPNRRVRFGGLCALVGGTVGLLLAPGFTSAELAFGSRAMAPGYRAPEVRTVVSSLIGFAPERTVYTIYGLLYALALLVTLPGLIALDARIGQRVGRHHVSSVAAGYAGGALIIAGLVGEHVIGASLTPTGANARQARSYEASQRVITGSLVVQFVGVLVLLVGVLLLGRAAYRANALPWWVAGPLVLALPVAIGTATTLVLFGNGPCWADARPWLVFVSFLFGDLPSGLLLPLDVGWVLTGYAIRTRQATS